MGTWVVWSRFRVPVSNRTSHDTDQEWTAHDAMWERVSGLSVLIEVSQRRGQGGEEKEACPRCDVPALRCCSLHKPAPPDADWHLLQSALWDLSFIFYGSFSSLPLPLLDSGAGESLSRSGVKAGRWKFRLLMCLPGGVFIKCPTDEW